MHKYINAYIHTYIQTPEPIDAEILGKHVASCLHIHIHKYNIHTQTPEPIDAEILGKHVASCFKGHIVSVGQDVLTEFQGNNLTLRITELEVTKGSQVGLYHVRARCMCVYVCGHIIHVYYTYN